MKELTKLFLPCIKVIIIPYLFIMFILVFPIKFYLNSPGGLAEVQNLIEVNYNLDKEITGTISSTYIMSIQRPTFFQFLVGNFSPYVNIGVLSGSNANYSNQEINKISFLDKETSVDAAIIVAYLEAGKENPAIKINYEKKVLVHGKAEYLDHYDQIDFGDEFEKVIGDLGQVVTDVSKISDYTILNNSYDWYFLNSSGTEYMVTLSKDEETNKFGIYLQEYYLVNQEGTFPTYQEKSSNIGGPSGGLLQTLAIYNMLADKDLTYGLKIAGTGTISYDGSVGYIGGVEQKIITAYINKVDVFFIPNLDDSYYYDNYQEALRACEEHNIDPTGWLIPITSFQDALDYLEGLDNE